MRVLIVSQRYPPARLAGQELQAQLLARALARRGVEVQVLTTSAPGESAPTEALLPVTSIRVLGGPLRRVSQWWRVRRHLNAARYEPDIVHCHCISPTSLAAVRHFRRRGIPVLLQSSLGGPGGEFERARLPGAWPVIRRAIRSATGYPVLDDVIGEELLALGIAPRRLFPVQNGVDLDYFRPVSQAGKERLRASMGLPGGPVALFVGQLEIRKGLVDLLSIWPDVIAGQPDSQLVIVGTGTLEDRVRQHARLDPSIRFLGVRTDVNRCMQAADLLVLPSYNESFGCVITEALACGLPVVTTGTGIVRRLAIDGRAGRVICAGNRAELTNVLLDILVDEEQRCRFRACAIESAAAFDIELLVEQVIAQYRQVAR